MPLQPTIHRSWAIAMVLAMTACGPSRATQPTPPADATTPSTPNAGTAPGGNAGASSAASNSFDHPGTLGGDIASASEVIRGFEELGPPSYQARVPSCKKLCYVCVGKILSQLGLTDASAAVQLWRTSKNALGGPNYGAFIQESAEVTAGAASKLFDIFVQAAGELLAAPPAACGGALFGAADCSQGNGGCSANALSCVTGLPATSQHIAACNRAVCRVVSPTTPVEKAQQLALAAALSAMHTCE